MTAYQLVWDNSLGDVSIVAYQGMDLSKLVVGLVLGSDYQFKVRPQNVYGFGELSDTVTIRASTIPNTMNIVESNTVLQAVVISWEEPGNGGDDLLAYDLQILTPEGDFVNYSLCDGAIESGLECVLPHSHLIDTYQFNVGDVVQVRVRAQNAKGWGNYSQLNVGNAYIMTVPAQMAPPTEGALTTYDKI